MNGRSNGNGRSIACSMDSLMVRPTVEGEPSMNGGIHPAPVASNGLILQTVTTGTNGASRTREKLINDIVHGHMSFTGPCLEVLDTPQVQRLRKLKQLGAVPWVFPSANHSRFEHSLGVCHLAGQLAQRIYDKQRHELDMEKTEVETVKVAGLVHDLGHGPFSHIFDNEVIKLLDPHTNWKHEEMSADMFGWLVDEHHLDLDEDFVRNVKELVTASLPEGEQNLERTMKTKKFLYDIVANGRTGIDVDKFDYLARDSHLCNVKISFDHNRVMKKTMVVEDKICFRWSEAEAVYDMFTARGHLHRTVYTHRKVKAIEYMIVDALKEATPVFKWLEAIRSPKEFYKLNDAVLDRIEFGTDDGLKRSQGILDRLNRRDLYEYINECSVPVERIPYYKKNKVTANDIAAHQCDGYLRFRPEDIIVQNMKIDFGFGMKNPVDDVGWYEDTEDGGLRSYLLTKDQISNMLPGGICDLKIRVYSRKNTREMVEAVGKAFERYQERQFQGELRQPHSTTPSKRKWPGSAPSSPRSPVPRRVYFS